MTISKHRSEISKNSSMISKDGLERSIELLSGLDHQGDHQHLGLRLAAD